MNKQQDNWKMERKQKAHNNNIFLICIIYVILNVNLNYFT